MKLIGDISTKTLMQTAPGELIKINAGDAFHFGVVLALDSKPPMVGFLQPTGKAPGPVYRRISDRKCISYGNDWVVEPILGEESWPGNSKYQVTSGALFIAGQSAIVSFQPCEEFHDSIEVYFNLNTGHFEDVYPREMAAPVLRWRIWESADACRQSKGGPITEIDVRSTS